MKQYRAAVITHFAVLMGKKFAIYSGERGPILLRIAATFHMAASLLLFAVVLFTHDLSRKLKYFLPWFAWMSALNAISSQTINSTVLAKLSKLYESRSGDAWCFHHYLPQFFINWIPRGWWRMHWLNKLSQKSLNFQTKSPFFWKRESVLKLQLKYWVYKLPLMKIQW